MFSVVETKLSMGAICLNAISILKLVRIWQFQYRSSWIFPWYCRMAALIALINNLHVPCLWKCPHTLTLSLAMSLSLTDETANKASRNLWKHLHIFCFHLWYSAIFRRACLSQPAGGTHGERPQSPQPSTMRLSNIRHRQSSPDTWGSPAETRRGVSPSIT